MTMGSPLKCKLNNTISPVTMSQMLRRSIPKLSNRFLFAILLTSLV